MNFFEEWMSNPMTQVGIGLLSDPRANFGDLMAQQQQAAYQRSLIQQQEEQMALKRQELEQRLAAQKAQREQQSRMAGLLAIENNMPSDQMGPPDMNQAGIDQQMFMAMPELMEDVARARFIPEKPAADPASIREYNFALSQGYKGSYMDFVAEKGASSAPQINMPAQVPEYSKLPAGYVYARNADGSVKTDERGAPVALPIAGSPAEGEISPREKKQNAQARVAGNLEKMRDMYLELDMQGAAINTEASALENLSASLSASPLGQKVGQWTGSESQSVRNKINAMRPTLVNDIRQAAEMGAKGMDSEKELEFFLAAATDPSKDIQSNMAALKVLDDAYGLGLINFQVDKNAVTKIKSEAKAAIKSRDGWSIKRKD